MRGAAPSPLCWGLEFTELARVGRSPIGAMRLFLRSEGAVASRGYGSGEGREGQKDGAWRVPNGNGGPPRS